IYSPNNSGQQTTCFVVTINGVGGLNRKACRVRFTAMRAFDNAEKYRMKLMLIFGICSRCSELNWI
ncbi:hypothetical protein AB4501_29855, partial [Vibrio sp. 10N.222.55.E8]